MVENGLFWIQVLPPEIFIDAAAGQRDAGYRWMTTPSGCKKLLDKFCRPYKTRHATYSHEHEHVDPRPQSQATTVPAQR